MNRYIVLLLFALSCSLTGVGQSLGLQFSSHETVQEKRTSFNLTPVKPICLQGITDISFDVMFRPNMPIYFGYVLRIITSQNKNVDIVYNEPFRQLNFVTGEKWISCNVDSIHIFDQWNRLMIRFNEKEKSLSFFINDHQLGQSRADFNNESCSHISFGANDQAGFQTADIPPMLVKEIRITENKTLTYYYPLSESNGEEALEKVSGKKYKVLNPVWIAPMHQNWRLVYTNKVPGVPSVAFNRQKDMLYLVGADSLYELSVKGLSVKGIQLAEKRSHLAAGNQTVYNSIDGRLYNFYIDQKSVSVYDTAKAFWDKNFPIDPLTVFWHANKFISPADTSLYTIAGYGQLRYKNLIQRYHFPTQQWDTVHATGDFFMPRYLAALGMNETGDTAFILGGYGSKTGEQTLNPRHVYDLLAFSVRDKKFTQLTRLNEPEHPFCFSNSLVTEPGTDNYYTLIYPNDRFNSRLQLIKGSLHSPGYELMADTIPWQFYDVESFVDLFYSSGSKKLLAATFHTGKDSITDVKIYSLDFPPNKMITTADTAASAPISAWTYLIGLVALAAAGSIALYWYKKKKKAIAAVPVPSGPLETVSPAKAINTASVFLFGQFEVLTKEKQNVTHLFSPLLKELFLLILVHTYKDGKGISSEKLLEILWSDKSPRDARNNYQVNIAKLKSICEKAGCGNIGRDSGQLKFEQEEDAVYIDYKRFIELTDGRYVMDNAYVSLVVDLIQHGGFLAQLHYSWLDDVKSEVSGKISDIFVKYVNSVDAGANAELVLRFANAVFLFDQLNEEALIYKCKSLILLGRYGMAKDAFSKFTRDYKETYGVDFGKTFTQITGNT
jgi:DNA-binding SARP family transcriptional activator